jgi:NTE family protein
VKIPLPKLFWKLFALSLLCTMIFLPRQAAAQKVAVVLSGGGATALAHVGFLKVLEENNVPVDYITGTSMGAVIAAFYASGYSVAFIDSLVRTEEFLDMATGSRNEKLDYYFKNTDQDASFGAIRLSKDNLMSTALPTNLINPVLLDWKLMEAFTQPDAACNGNFDSLYIPFRCIAADIENKKEIIFREGPINVATRASCTYPFYIPARRVDGKLLFDGGIYNNFPIDVALKEFNPDIIIGCNVSGSNPKAADDDLISQLQAMILYRSQVQTYSSNALIVEPQLGDISTFDFDKIEEAIAIGYETTMAQLPVIKESIQREETLSSKNQQRVTFQEKFNPLLIDEIMIRGLKKSQSRYVQKIMAKGESKLDLNDLKRSYLKLFGDDKINTVFPSAQFKPENKSYRLDLDVKKEKNFLISFGGNFSSRSINSGFIGVKYNLFGYTSSTITANSYFGRFYGSVHSDIRWDISGKLPFSIQGGFTFNRWDYYKSLATFFEDVKPSYILLNEQFGNLSVSIPVGVRGITKIEQYYTHQFDDYYQIKNFISTDTADRTEFNAWITRASYERSSLNRKQFASEGTFLHLDVKWVNGSENTIPGSTSEIKSSFNKNHYWVAAKLNYINYFLRTRYAKTGFLLEGVWSNQGFFSNYISSLIIAPSFNPLPESRTFFLPQFRAHNYAAYGLMNVISFTKNVELRLEAYGFNPLNLITSDADGRALYTASQRATIMGSATLVLHSPIGPVSFASNYYDLKETPWSFIFNFGYILFNKSPRD